MEETFAPIEEKLKAAEYFFNKLKELEKNARHLSSADPFLTRVNLDGFFFEVIAAKDLFLQVVNKLFNAGLKSGEVNENKLLTSNIEQKAKDTVSKIKRLLSDESSWLWRLNNYRNVTSHRALLSRHIKIELGVGSKGEPPRFISLALDPDDSLKGGYPQEIIPYCEESLKRMQEFLEKLYNYIQ